MKHCCWSGQVRCAFTLPYQIYHTGKTLYRLVLRPLMGPMHIPELTVRLQNPQVQYSPGSIPIPGTIPLPRGGLLTWTYLLICTLDISKRISARKHISTSILVTMTRKTPNQETRVASPSTPCISSALLSNPKCLLQAHPVMLSAWLCSPGCLHQAHPVLSALLCNPGCLLRAHPVY